MLLKKSADNAERNLLTIKDPFTFEFLGLEVKDAVTESDLEQALMDHLQEFMLELGQGFCFEARKKRIIHDSFVVMKLTPELMDEYVERVEVHPDNEIRVIWK